MVYKTRLVGLYCLVAANLFDPVLSFARPSTESSRNGGGLVSRLERQHPRVHHRISPGLNTVAEGTKTSSNENTDNGNDETASIRYDSKLFFDVLQDAVHRNSTDASLLLLSKITEMRQSGEYTIEYQEDFLNNLLALGPDARLPIWTKFRPLARFSRRARMQVLRRTLDRITPPAADADKENDTVKSKLQRRRRALVSLVRSLSTEEAESDGAPESNQGLRRRGGDPAIVALEKKAARASKETATDLTARRPEGLETPDYDVIASGKDSSNNRLAKNVEIRRYKPYSVCAVSMAKPRPSDSAKTDQKLGSPELKGASSFGALAGYLFGKNDQSTAMKMTTPVFTTQPPVAIDDDDDDRQMEFVLPSNFWGSNNLSKAPLPLEGSGVTLQEKDGEDRAVLMFGGYASKKEVEKRKKELMAAVSKLDSQWKAVPDTDSLAQYNDPFTVPWRRLNEVSVQIVEGE
eukprot:CAMPEP_0172390860 /NCGR_PEP_ID=MMETSP1061-20121228/7417_1 /TAXON_ID=37318 /ORGANISM="Pseudo-nitzschia pungens, Strain cf. pungens" /LENGTH=462 /DNA_ID=CAMNT_0013121351 /DNA_START=224 /DNA_END=1612 /DNA_ORIENTATION=-